MVVVAEVVAAEAVARGTAMEAAVETVAAPEPEQAPRRAAPVSAVLQAQAEDTAVVRGEPAAAVPLVPRVLGGQVSAAHRVLAVPAPRVVRAQAGPESAVRPAAAVAAPARRVVRAGPGSAERRVLGAEAVTGTGMPVGMAPPPGWRAVPPVDLESEVQVLVVRRPPADPALPVPPQRLVGPPLVVSGRPARPDRPVPQRPLITATRPGRGLEPAAAGPQAPEVRAERRAPTASVPRA